MPGACPGVPVIWISGAWERIWRVTCGIYEWGLLGPNCKRNLREKRWVSEGERTRFFFSIVPKAVDSFRVNSSCKDSRLFNNGFSSGKKDSWARRGYTGLARPSTGGRALPHYGRQHNHNWTATKELPPAQCTPLLCGSGRFPAQPCSPQRHCIEYNKMLVPQSDKPMKFASPAIFGTIIIFFIFLLDAVSLR